METRRYPVTLTYQRIGGLEISVPCNGIDDALRKVSDAGNVTWNIEFFRIVLDYQNGLIDREFRAGIGITIVNGKPIDFTDPRFGPGTPFYAYSPGTVTLTTEDIDILDAALHAGYEYSGLWIYHIFSESGDRVNTAVARLIGLRQRQKMGLPSSGLSA